MLKCKDWPHFEVLLLNIRGQFHQCSTSSFYAQRSQKRKETVKLSSFIAFLGSVHIKAARRTLVKLTSDVSVKNVKANLIQEFHFTFLTSFKIVDLFLEKQILQFVSWRKKFP